MTDEDVGPDNSKSRGDGCSFVVMAPDEIESLEHSENEGRSSLFRHQVTASGRFSESAEGTLVMRGIDETGIVVAKNSTPVSGSSFELAMETDERWHIIYLVVYEFE